VQLWYNLIYSPVEIYTFSFKMLCHQHIRFGKIQLFLSKLCFSLPLEWNSKSQRLQVVPFRKTLFWSLLILSTCLYISRVLLTSRVMYQLYHPEFQRRHNHLPYTKHQALNMAIGVFIFCCMQVANTSQRQTVCQFINSLVDFELRYYKGV